MFLFPSLEVVVTLFPGIGLDNEEYYRDRDEVKIRFYKNGEEMAFIDFTGESTDKENWFAKERVRESSFENIKRENTNYFSIKGHSNSDVRRQFFTNKNYGGCENDYGWTVVVSQDGNCMWERKQTEYPLIMYSPVPNGVLWQSDDPGIADFMAIFLEFTDTCQHEVVLINGVTYTFETSPSEFLAHSLELCSFETPLAVRMCNIDPRGGGVWGEVTVQPCTTYTISDLAKVDITEENAEEVAMQLSTLTSEENMDNEVNIDDVALILEGLTGVGAGNEMITGLTVNVVSNIQYADDDVFTADNNSMSAASSIVKSLETQIGSVSNFKGVENNLAVQTKQYLPEALQNGIGFASLEPENTESGLQEENIETFEDVEDFLMDMIETSIALPPEIVELNQDQTGSNQIQVSFIVYQTSKLFASNRLMSNQDRAIGSRVISATVEKVTVEGLYEPIRAAYLPVLEDVSGNPECVYWDFELENGQGDWSNESCYFNKTSDGRIVCFCDHLTNFAVIMDYSGQAGPTTTFQDALTYISIIGCVISIVCLVITIITFTYFRHLRGKRPQRILVNLCFSLLFLYTTFVIGIELTTCYYCCIVVAILLHYFVLTTLFWMLVEAVNMYLKFVLVFYDEVRFFMLKSVLVGWVLPIIPVTIIAVLDYEDTYSNDEYCFMKPGYPLYFGLLVISAIVLVINFAIYVQIIRRLTCRRRVTKIKTDKDKMNELAVRVQNAIAIMMLLGLTWIFGFFAIDSSEAVRDLFQLLFCVCNSLQGFFIFLLFCVRRKDVRNSWAYSCCSIGEKPGIFMTTTSRQRYATEKTTVSGNSVNQSKA
ncbi:adhesion G-protein coupled receptor G6-like isoform X2 [Antedon mediterranea]|uniref:adhesion G-protein coupled receptor G6-like isoform X2 n=1 Tax=Antedon mediterranea TaxID=105859 RepID=UPI003AF6907B